MLAMKLTIRPEQVSAFTLQRQHLLHPAEDPQQVVRDLIAIQAQYPSGLSLTLWARCFYLWRDWLDDALYEGRSLVKTWCLRGAVHIIDSQDLGLMVASVGRSQSREHRHFMQTRRGFSQGEIENLNQMILQALQRRILTREQLHSAIPKLNRIAGASWGLDVKDLAFSGDLVFADPVGPLSRFATREIWMLSGSLDLHSEEEACRDLLMRYLASYGPATPQDFAHWTGLKMEVVNQIFSVCTPNLIQIEAPGYRGNLFLRAQDESLLQDGEVSLPVIRLLPKFDPILMGYRDKTRFIDREHIERVYRTAGQVEAVILLNGRVAATWRAALLGKGLLRFTLDPFLPFSKPEQAILEEAVEKMRVFLLAKELELVFQLA
jgi:hypothetical protein